MAPFELPLFPVASVDAAIAFQRGGFEVTIQTSERLVLERDERKIVLRRGHVMSPPELLLVLRAAAVTPEEFLDWLAPPPRHASGMRPRLTSGAPSESADSRDIPPALKVENEKK